jgi:hypothetical protein
VWIALVERRGAWASVRGGGGGPGGAPAAAAEADAAVEAAAIGGVAAHIDGLAALLAVAGAPDEHAVQARRAPRPRAASVRGDAPNLAGAAACGGSAPAWACRRSRGPTRTRACTCGLLC